MQKHKELSSLCKLFPLRRIPAYLQAAVFAEDGFDDGWEDGLEDGLEDGWEDGFDDVALEEEEEPFKSEELVPLP